MTFQKMRWDCKKAGCFNKKCRLDFEVFYSALPGKISFSDLDGIVEVNGNGLMIEWKSRPVKIDKGQNIMFERLSIGKLISVLCLAGDAETMTVTHLACYFDGKWRPWIEGTTEDAYNIIKNWVKWTEKNSRI